MFEVCLCLFLLERQVEEGIREVEIDEEIEGGRWFTVRQGGWQVCLCLFLAPGEASLFAPLPV